MGLSATEDTSTLSLKAFLLPLILEPPPHWSQSCSLNMEGTLYWLTAPLSLFPRLLSGSYSYLPVLLGSVALWYAMLPGLLCIWIFWLSC